MDGLGFVVLHKREYRIPHDVGAADGQGVHVRLLEEVEGSFEVGVEAFVMGAVFQRVDNHGGTFLSQ
jgi:hypothetical protein